MANYYVDPDGLGGTPNDGNSGTISSPWEHIDASVGKGLTGGTDKIILRGGEHEGGSRADDMAAGSAGTGFIVIENYPSEVATIFSDINGNQRDCFAFPQTKEYIRLQALTQGGIVLDGRKDEASLQARYGCAWGNTGGVVANNCELINVEIKNCFNSGAQNRSSTNSVLQGNLVYNCGQSPSNQSHGLYVAGNGLRVLGNIVHSCAGWNIHAFGSGAATSDWIIAKNRCYGAVAGSGIIVYNGSDVNVWSNVCYKNAHYGIDVNDGNNVNVAHNTVHENTFGGIIWGLFGTTGNDLKNNLVSNATFSIKITSHGQNTDLFVRWNRTNTAIVNDRGSDPNVILSNNSTGVVIGDECVDPTNATLGSRNYALKAGAASIGATTTNEVPAIGYVTEDATGGARLKGPFVDQGAYEYGDAPPAAPQVTVAGNPVNVSADETWQSMGVGVTDDDAADSDTVTGSIDSAGEASVRLTSTEFVLVDV